MPAPPETYFEKIDARLPKHGEDVARLKRDGILIDGEGVVEGRHTKVLLQIFSANAVGPIFFEFIQRKGDGWFRRRQFQGLVRIDRGRPDSPRCADAERPRRRVYYHLRHSGMRTWRRPGIHTPCRGYGFRARSFCSRPGMTGDDATSRLATRA